MIKARTYIDAQDKNSRGAIEHYEAVLHVTINYEFYSANGSSTVLASLLYKQFLQRNIVEKQT